MPYERGLFHRGHHNILAKQIRQQYPSIILSTTETSKHYGLGRRAALEDLALSLAKRLKEDDQNFDPIKWLDQCSPDPELYPFSELWKEEKIEIEGTIGG
jgi:hypothetical protein